MQSPFPITYRELWMAPNINSTQLATSASGGHVLTLTAGASKKTTADGVRFTGAATSNVVVVSNAAQNNKAAFHFTVRFKLFNAFAAGAAGDFYLFRKALDANNYIRVYLKAVDGKLYWEQGNGVGGLQFSLTSTTVSWAANTWYVVTVSLTDVPTQRLIVNGSIEDTDVAGAIATPNGGDMVIGSSSDGGVDGVIGTLSWVVIGVGVTATVALTTDQESDLYKGFPPPSAKVQHMYTFDEGRGTVATDRGSVGVNGTLDSSSLWNFGQVKQAAVSFDSLNNNVTSATSVDISGPISLVWIGKIKSTYITSGTTRVLLFIRSTIADSLEILVNSSGSLRFNVRYSGTDHLAFSSPAFSIDNYGIILATLDASGNQALYFNGALIASGAGVNMLGPELATAYMGVDHVAGEMDISKPILAALISGAMTANEVKDYSKWLRDRYNLPISI